MAATYGKTLLLVTIMKRGCGLMLLEKASEGTAEESRHSVQQWSVEKGIENTSVASSTNEPSVWWMGEGANAADSSALSRHKAAPSMDFVLVMRIVEIPIERGIGNGGPTINLE
ncbi:hypothetical protein MSG28_013845 [Choristoneura fumiferana]|uniref:Uncharacterized protein n=1 Tax=Choristoneura fumiferana TaxID=7141 RepID=A0ACC0K8X7_CHOFU|nr:hypothetical protein MSG28_013845 [Choristoneura fumiferana]